MRSLPHAGATDRALASYSHAGEHARLWLTIGIVGAALDHDHRSQWARGTAAVAATEAASQMIKRRVRRSRPTLVGLPPLAATPSRFSFPSAHTASACAATGAFPSTIPRPVLAGGAIVMALSRPYLGVHYPSDVVAGALVGALAGRAARAAHGS